MKQVIVCECGTIVRGDDDQELLKRARGHMESNHPAVAAQITDKQLLALSQEEPAPGALED
jgi:predicted small metal-binding protein